MENNLADILYDILGPSILVLSVVLPILFKLSSDLAKLNTEVAYQLNRDLLTKRFTAYGDLWSRMKPVAIYSGEEFKPSIMNGLSESLSLWYFSCEGGLLLTERAKAFYFAFQNFLITVGNMAGWSCQERPRNSKERFLQLLRSFDQNNPEVKECLKYLESGKPHLLDPAKWSVVCELISEKLTAKLEGKQDFAVKHNPVDVGREIYAATQQISSVLRSNLAYELQSRLDLPRPKI